MSHFDFRKGNARLAALAVVMGGVLVGVSVAGQGGGKQPPSPMQPGTSRESQVMGDYFVKTPGLYDDVQAYSPSAGELVLHVKAGISAETIANRYSVKVVRKLNDGQSMVVRSDTADITLARMQRDKDILGVQREEVRARDKHQFNPNDPLFPYNSPAGFPGQWHLKNGSGVASVPDVKIDGAWNKFNDFGSLVTNTGSTVLLGIVDDGFQTAHPDLTANYNAANSRDFGQADNDPNPVNAGDDHGTAVAGVAVARGNNGVGVTGAAPEASFAGLRVDFGTSPTSHFVDATTWNSSGANTNIKIKNHSYGYTAPFVAAATEVTALETSATAGTIHTWSAGNARGTRTQDANKLATQSSPSAITVAALASSGRFAPYSNFGANVFVTAPSSGYFNPETGFSEGDYAITTTDRTGANGYNPTFDILPNTDYTSQFGGTSSSSPLVAGILALAKKNQSNLNTRWAKHLLVRTSDIVHADDNSISSDGGWKTNAAGFKFNQNYGFGLINADKLAQAALKSTGVSALTTNTSGTLTAGVSIPDNSNTGVTRTWAASVATTPLEEVQVTINATHTYRGDLEAYLTSPQGTTSRLFIRSGSDSAANLAWTFTSNAFWGENPNGTWTLKVIDTFAGDTGTLTNWAVTLRQGTVSWNDAKFVSQSVPSVIQAGATVAGSMTFQNTGSTTWTQAAGYKLNTQNTIDNNTFGFTRVNLAGGDSIAPGQSKNYAFNMTAPATIGDYNFQLRSFIEGVFRFGDFSPPTNVTVVSTGRNAWFISQSVPTTMKKDNVYFISITMRNMGNTTWTDDGTITYRMGSMNPMDNIIWRTRRLYMPLGTTVPPGQTYTFNAELRAPTTAGTYNFQWRMLQEGVTFFGDTTPNVVVNVTN